MTNLNILFKGGSSERRWVAERDLPHDNNRPPFYLVPVAGAVLAAHLGLFALLVSQTSTKDIVLSNITPPASVRVTMVAPPPPPEPPTPVEPQPPTPQVLTSENAERTIAQQEPKPEPPKPKPVPKPEPKPKPKPQPKPEPKPVPKPPEAVTQAEPSPPSPPAPQVAEPQQKMLDLPSAGPKDVQTVGCRVPAPEYPRKARRMAWEGSVLIRLVIDMSGKIQSATVARSSGNQDLDEAARKAVMAASCSPYLENGRAISVRAAQPVSFRLNR